MSLRPGDDAPPFQLPHVPGEAPVSLDQLTSDGSAVLLFFPLAWSPVCTQELCSVRDDMGRYRELDARVVGISVDSPFALQAWAKEQGYDFPLLSDFNGDVSRDYGALYDEFFGMKGVSKRAAFVVDENGTVRYAEVLEDASQVPDLAAVREVLRDLA